MAFTERDGGVDLPEWLGDAYGEPVRERDGETYGDTIRERDGDTYSEPRREPDGDTYGGIWRERKRLDDDDGDNGNLMWISLDPMDISPMCVCTRSAMALCLESNEVTSEDFGRDLRCGDVARYP